MLQKILRKKSGFTLIELMIVVVIIGILAAVAIPAFIRFIKRSKTSEASSLVRSLYEGAKTYYDREQWTQGLVAPGSTASASSNCTVLGGVNTGNTIGSSKTMIDVSTMSSFTALGFAPSGPIYYQYLISGTNANGSCGHSTGESIYTFQAIGDLDGDGAASTFELQAGSDNENNLYHSPGMYMVDELE